MSAIHLLASIGIMVGMVMLGLAVGSARDELAAKRDGGGQVSNFDHFDSASISGRAQDHGE